MMGCRTRRRRRLASFTLLELLVVIGIIGLLLAILLPALQGVWRRAQVLACPIVYLDANRNVWLTDPRGERQLLVSTEPAYSEPRWSPRGDRILFLTTQGSAILNPATGKKQYVKGLNNPCWISQDEIIGFAWNGKGMDLWRVDVNTGNARLWIPLTAQGEWDGGAHIYYDPAMLDGFITAQADVMDAARMDVIMRGPKWGMKRPIWYDRGEPVMDMGPRCDVMGEWVAWTRSRGPGYVAERYVALKPVKSHSSVAPTLLGGEYPSAWLCDWTPDGKLLVCLLKADGSVALAIMTREGRVERELKCAQKLLNLEGGTIAEWRRYERW